METIDSRKLDRLTSDLASRLQRTSILIANSYLADMIRQGHCVADTLSPVGLAMVGVRAEGSAES